MLILDWFRVKNAPHLKHCYVAEMKGLTIKRLEGIRPELSQHGQFVNISGWQQLHHRLVSLRVLVLILASSHVYQLYASFSHFGHSHRRCDVCVVVDDFDSE